MKLGFMGGGIMAEAIVKGVLGKGAATAEDISVCEIMAPRRQFLRETYRVAATADVAEALRSAEIVILAVKPQEFPVAAKEIKAALQDSQTVMSIMAGVRIAALSEALSHKAIVRVIPNTPAQVGEGASVWTATPEVTEAARGEVAKILSALGLEAYVDDEKYIDMATAVSSSGPAYIFLVIEAMIDAAVHIGMRRELAAPLVIQTVLGSARYAQASGKHPAELKNQVTSPGGTTVEGLLALEEAGLRAAFTAAIEAAYEKAVRLGG